MLLYVIGVITDDKIIAELTERGKLNLVLTRLLVRD